MDKKQSQYKCKPCDPKDVDKAADVCMVCEVSGSDAKLKIVKKSGRQSITHYKNNKK